MPPLPPPRPPGSTARWALFWLLWLCLCPWASAAPPPAPTSAPLVLRDESGTVQAWPAVTVLADASRQRTLADMQAQASKFEAPAGAGGTLGVQPEAMWLHMGLVRTAAQVASEERDAMRSLAHTDALTGLPNRRGLSAALSSALAHCDSRSLLAVYMMDLDGFKLINDQHGHDVGDALLVAATRRLLAQVRQKDVVARLGGDEFVVTTSGLGTPQQAQDLGHKLLEAFRPPFVLGDIEVSVGITIGYAIAPHDGNDAITLLKRADAAMYSGKQSGKFCVRRNPGDLALSSA